MDILNIEGGTFPLKLKSYIDGSELGITFDLEPFSISADVDSWVQNSIAMKQIEIASGGGDGRLSADQFAEVDKEATIRKAVASIKSWDWGGHSFGDLWVSGENPPCTDELKNAVLRHARASWIVAQVKDAGSRVANFLPKSEVTP